jgi:hypothetical protein
MFPPLNLPSRQATALSDSPDCAKISQAVLLVLSFDGRAKWSKRRTPVGTHLHLLQLLRRISAAREFDLARARLRVEAMSSLELFKHGRRCAEACWLAGQKRPLTAREIAEFRLVREEWEKRKTRGASERRRYRRDISGAASSRAKSVSPPTSPAPR